MGPIYRFHDGKGTRTIDLRGVQSIYRFDDRAVWAVGGLNYLFDVPASVGEELEAAWIAYVGGEHTPAEPVGVPQLPEGWEWREIDNGTRAVCPFDGQRHATAYTSGVVVAAAPPEVVLAVIATHRARGGA